MKKIIIIVLAVFLWAGAIAPAFALLRRDFSAIEAPVVAKKQAEKQIVIKHANGDEEIFTADDNQLRSVQVGDTVLILHQRDTNAISTLVVTVPKP